MAGEFFQSERGQIKAVEAQAQKEKKDKVSTELQAKKDLFHTEVGKAGKLLADAEAKVTLPASKDKVSGYKKDISSTLKDIVNSGQMALKAENPDADLAVIDMLAGSLKSTLGTVKQYVPLFNDVEAAKAQVPKIDEKLKKARDAKEKNGAKSKEFNSALDEADELVGKAKEEQIYLWKPEALPADMQGILMSVLGPLKDQEAEVAGYRLDRIQKESLEDDPNDPPESKEHKAAMRILKPAKAAFDAVQPNMKKISDALKESKTTPEKLAEVSGTIDSSITDLGAVLKQLNTIDKSKFVDPEFTNLYENTLQKVQLQLSDLANVKIAIKTKELMTNGLTDEEKKYVTMDAKGNIMKTPEFAKLTKDKQMALEAKFKLIEMEVSMELDEKTAGEKEKKMIEGRKKLMAGDPFGAKEDLLAYYNQEGKNPEKDPVRFEQAKEMLKQIAKMELSQMVQRLAAMKASIKDRYNNNAFGKTDYGTQTVGQAQDNIDSMARIIDAAEEMIESGKCVTIEGAEALLKKFEFPPNTVQGVQAMDEKVAEIKQKGEEDLKKGKEDRLKREQDEVTRLQNAIKQLESGEIKATLTGEPITTEYIQKQKDRLTEQQAKVRKTEGMSLEDERAAELQPAELQLKKAKLDRALKSWKLGFPVDMKSNSWEVFDMFVQQRKLNDPDPEVRKQATLEEAKKARDRGFTGLAREMYEAYFSDQLKEGAKGVDKKEVREKTLKSPDVVKRLDEGMKTWKSDYKKQWGRDPEDNEVEEARGKMQAMVVSEAYNKEVKLSTYSMLKDATGPEAEEWKKVYGGTVAIENFGQGGVLTAFWTDEEWNALPVKVGVFTAVTIASAGIGSAAVAGTGMAARAVLGEVIVGRVLATGGGRALAWAGSTAVEGIAFSAAQYEFNNMLLGNGYERFSTEYWKAMGHSVLTMGILKGVGTSVGKLRKLAEAGKAPSFIEGGVGAMAKDAGWWLGKTSLEGGAMVGLDAGMAFLSGRHFTAKEAAKSFGENFIFSAAMGGVHEFMGQGAHEAPKEKKMVEEINTAEAIGKSSKAQIEVDRAQSNLDKAKAEGKPTEKLEADLAAKKKAAEGAEGKVAVAEKLEGEAHKENIEKRKTELETEIAKQQKEGKVDPGLVAQLKIAEALLGSLKGGEGSDKGPYRSPSGVKIDVETLGIFEKYTNALLSKDASELATLRSRFPQHAEMFGVIEKQANSVKSGRDAVILLITGEVSSLVEGQKLTTPAEIAAFVEAYNAKNKPVENGEAQVVAKLPDGKGMLFIDKNGKLQYLEKSAAESHFYSTFDKGVPASMLEEVGPNGQKKESKDIPAWIDTDGKIHYNNDYFQAKYGVEMKQVAGVDGKMVNVFVVGGVEMGAKEFFKTHPQGKEILQKMSQEKNHEVSHRLLEARDKASGGKFGEQLVEAVKADPELSALFAQRGQEMNPRNVQEFLCEIADQRHDSVLSMKAKGNAEWAIGREIPGFTFDKARQLDTQGLKFSSPDIFMRSTADASFDGTSGILTKGKAINIPGSKYEGWFISSIYPDGTIDLASTLNIKHTALHQMATLNDILAGTIFNGKKIVGVTQSGTVMFEKQPGSPFAETANVNDVLGIAPKKTLQIGQAVSVFNSTGNAIYDGYQFVGVNHQTGEVAISKIENGQQKTKIYANMDQLMQQIDLAAGIRKLPPTIDLVNAQGGLDKGWKVTGADMQNGGIVLQSPDGRYFKVPTLEALHQQMQNAEAVKTKQKTEMDKQLQKVPQSIDLVAQDGTISEGWKLEGVNYENGMVRVRSKDGKLFMDYRITDLVTHVEQARILKAPKQAPNLPPVAPVYNNAPDVNKMKFERNEVKQPPEKVQRSVEVGMVGDLHGNFEIMLDSLKALGMVTPNSTDLNNLQWSGGNKKLVFHGDILADRNTSSLDIMAAIRKLQVEAAKQGGSVELIAGNHEDFAISFLTGKKVPGPKGQMTDVLNYLFSGGQADGIVEFARKYATDPALRNVTSVMDGPFMDRMGKQPPLGQEILENMRKDPEGRKILEQMASMKLAEYINDTIYMHTEMTPEILTALQSNGNTVGQSIDKINQTYQQGLRFTLLGEGSMPPNFAEVSNTFTGTYNRDYVNKPGAMKWLNDNGVNYVVHGHSHTDVGSNVNPTTDGVTIIGVDHSAGKKGGGAKAGADLSIGVIKKDGQFTDKP